MGRFFFNITFTAVFLLLLSLIVNFYSDAFATAFTIKQAAFPRDERFNLSECQGWTREVRDFKVKEGEEANQIPVLMYHKIIDDRHLNKDHLGDDGKINSTIVLKSDFEKQMDLLKEEGYTTLTSAEFKLFMENKLEIPQRSIVITFDDGFKNNFKEAYPILKKNGLTAVNFVITSYVSSEDEEYDKQGLQYFSISDMEKSCDVFDIQSHTYNFHQRDQGGTAYLVSKSKDKIKEDIASSLINLDDRNLSFSYPYGEYDNETIQALKELNIGMAFTIEYKDARPGMDMYKIPRKTVYTEDTMEIFKVKINLE